jgi:hypothetical protein
VICSGIIITGMGMGGVIFTHDPRQISGFLEEKR